MGIIIFLLLFFFVLFFYVPKLFLNNYLLVFIFGILLFDMVIGEVSKSLAHPVVKSSFRVISMRMFVYIKSL